MDPDDIVIEYLRGKLKGARGKRADALLQPAPVEAEAEAEMAPEDMAQLEALMAEQPQEMAAEGPCPECGAAPGECECSKGM